MEIIFPESTILPAIEIHLHLKQTELDEEYLELLAQKIATLP